MTKFALMIAAGAFAAAPLLAVTAPAMAQGLDVHVGEGHHDHDVVKVEPKHHDCKTVKITERRHGHKVTRTERKCD